MFDLDFNPTKSQVMVFSKRLIDYDSIKPIVLNNVTVDFVSSTKYLGTTIVRQRGFTYSSEADLKCFYRSVNSVLNVINGPNGIVQMHLLYANGVPILTYASEIKLFPSREMTNCNTALNNVIRKVFLYKFVGEHSHPQRGLLLQIFD